MLDLKSLSVQSIGLMVLQKTANPLTYLSTMADVASLFTPAAPAVRLMRAGELMLKYAVRPVLSQVPGGAALGSFVTLRPDSIPGRMIAKGQFQAASKVGLVNALAAVRNAQQWQSLWEQRPRQMDRQPDRVDALFFSFVKDGSFSEREIRAWAKQGGCSNDQSDRLVAVLTERAEAWSGTAVTRHSQRRYEINQRALRTRVWDLPQPVLDNLLKRRELTQRQWDTLTADHGLTTAQHAALLEVLTPAAEATTYTLKPTYRHAVDQALNGFDRASWLTSVGMGHQTINWDAIQYSNADRLVLLYAARGSVSPSGVAAWLAHQGVSRTEIETITPDLKAAIEKLETAGILAGYQPDGDVVYRINQPLLSELRRHNFDHAHRQLFEALQNRHTITHKSLDYQLLFKAELGPTERALFCGKDQTWVADATALGLLTPVASPQRRYRLHANYRAHWTTVTQTDNLEMWLKHNGWDAVDLTQTRLEPADHLALSILTTGPLTRRRVSEYLTRAGLPESGPDAAALTTAIRAAAERLETHRIVMKHHWGWTLRKTTRHPLTPELIPPLPEILDRLRPEDLVKTIANRYGSYTREHLETYLANHSQAPNIDRLDQACTGLAGDWMSYSIPDDAWTVTPNLDAPTTEFTWANRPKTEPTRIIDRTIAAIIDRYGVFSEHTFEQHWNSLKTATPTLVPQGLTQAEKNAVGEQLVEQAKQNFDLVDYARSQGWELKKFKPNWYKVKGEGGLFLASTHWWSYSEEDGGSNLKFYQREHHCSFKDAVEACAGRTYAEAYRDAETGQARTNRPVSPKPPVQDRREAPEKPPLNPADLDLAPNTKRAFAYLTRTRAIPGPLVNDLIQAGTIRQDERGNALFIGYDPSGAVRHITKRGTLSHKRFTGTQAGSDKHYPFAIQPKTYDRVVLCESPIDAMSKAALESSALRRRTCYQAGAGLSAAPLTRHLKNGVKTVVLCPDNDQAGLRKAALTQVDLNDRTIAITIELPPNEKDWNAYLQTQRLGTKSDGITRAQGTQALAAHIEAARKKLATPEPTPKRPSTQTPEWRTSYRRHRTRLTAQIRTGIYREVQRDNPALDAALRAHLGRALDSRVTMARAQWDRLSVDPLFGKSLSKHGINRVELNFLAQLGRFGCGDKSAFDQHLTSAVNETLVANRRNGDWDHVAVRAAYDDSANHGIGRLISAGLIRSDRYTIRTVRGHQRIQNYTLTEKGAALLNAQGFAKPKWVGKFQKKSSELRHELLVHHTYQRLKAESFLRGEHITAIKTDREIRGETQSALMQIKAELRRTGWSTRKERLHEDLTAIEDGRRPGTTLTLEQRTTLDRLRHQRARVQPETLTRYHQLTATRLVDLQITVQTPTPTGTESAIQNWEIDAGENGSGRGGYTSREIVEKASAIPGLNWATPGGLSSGQGQRIAHAIVNTPSPGLVYSI